MSRPPVGHIEDEQLLRYADGEAPARVASEIRSHLEACWQCREQLEELQNTVGGCVRYRKNILQRHLPPPPAPWADIYRGFAKIDSELDPGSLWERITGVLRAPVFSARAWASLAVALLVVCTLFYRFRQTPSVEAAELLRKAIAAEDAHPAKARRIEIRTRDRRFTRVTGVDTAASPVQALFQAAHYDWADPLSAKSYQAWRDRLADRQDEVVEERDAYRIRTTATSGELMTATLKISRQELRPVEERFEFRNQEWVEIKEVDENGAPTPALIAAAPDIKGNIGAKTLVSVPSSGPTIGDELHVLAALHEAGADLGDPIEVSRTSGEILVAGVGIAPERQQEISGALSSQKHVVVRFSESPPARVQPEEQASTESAGDADIQQLQARLAEKVGGRVYFSQLAAQALDLSEPMMARAYALRRLAERIPIEAESALNAQDRQLLRNIRQEHTAALRRQTAEIDRLLGPALASVSGASRTPPDRVTFSGSWQPATEELFQSARRVDKLLGVMFGAATGESSGEQLPSQLLSSLAQLRSGLEAYDRLSTQALERRK
jgi:hypothetical protein